MHITEEPNEEIQLHRVHMNCDADFENIPAPLPCRAFNMLICGAPGSGKSSLLISLLSQKKPKLYRGVFENVFVIAPSASLASVKSNVFRNHPPEKIYNELTPSVLEEVKAKALAEAEEGFKSLLVIDDMTVYLKNKEIEQILKDLIFNRRHYHLSLIFCIQSYTQMPLSLRKSITHGALVGKPKNKKEFSSIFEEIIFYPKEQIPDIEKFIYDKPHNFMFFNIETGEIYKNFNKLIIEE